MLAEEAKKNPYNKAKGSVLGLEEGEVEGWKAKRNAGDT